MLWLCIHLPALPLEIFTRHQARHFYQNQSGGKAIVEQQTIISLDSAAETAGVQRGMSITTAYTLSDSLQVKQRDTPKEQQALQELAHWAYDISPAINVYNSNSLMLEVGGVLKLYGGLNNVLHRLHDGLTKMGYQHQYGIAHTPKAAHLAAHTTPNSSQYFNHDTQQFDTAAFKSALNTVALSALNQGDTLQRKFKQLGLTTVGELMQLPISAVGKRFGANFLRYFAELRGEISDPQTAIKPPESFSRSFFFNQNVEHVGGLRFPMKRLLSELCDYLQQHQWRCESIEWRLSCHNGNNQTLLLPLHSHSSSHEALFELSQLRFESVKLRGPVEQISLHSRQFSPLECVNNTLFDEAKANTNIGGLIDKLHTKLGRNNVYQLQAKHSHVPEQAFAQLDANSNQPVQMDLGFGAKRPTWLLPKPEPIKQTQDGLYWRGKLTLIEGPERVQSQWHQHAIVRDYFTARHESGEVYWVYHNQHNNQWFTHGVFS